MDRARRFRIARVALPCVVAAIQVLGATAVAHWRGLQLPPQGYALLLLSAVLLFWMFRRPTLVLGGETLLTGAYALAGFPPGPAFLAFVLALVYAGARGRRWQAWTVVGLVTVVVVVSAAGWFRGSFWEHVSLPDGAPPFLAAGVLLGEAARRRRQRISELRHQRMARRQAERDEYRLTLARDIHDVVGHSLSLINVQASVALHLGEKDPARLVAALEDIKQASKDSLAEVRELLDVLRDPGQEGGAPLSPSRVRRSADSLAALIDEARDGGLRVTLKPPDGRGPAPSPREWARPCDVLDDGGRDALYRAVQEALSNVRRHAAHPEAVLGLEQHEDSVRLECTNPMDGREPREGHGLRGMRERVAAAGGSVDAVSRDEEFSLVVLLPIGPGTHQGAVPDDGLTWSRRDDELL
ncbi:sensor histidine kinase [Arthrobacter sp. NPDC090010]|uniref:sensor histidine kinase n=1 Tax=Arthrobacter sp. NPDC090010 TaxID=3363942 RepID=UPI0038206B4A